MDKETGEPLLVGEEQVISEAAFTPAEPNGTVDVLFTFDASTVPWALLSCELPALRCR